MISTLQQRPVGFVEQRGERPGDVGATAPKVLGASLSAPAPDVAGATRPHEVAVLVQAGVLPFDVASAVQLFAGDDASDQTQPYHLTVCAVTPGAVHTSDAFDLYVTAGLEQLERADTVVVAGGAAPVATPPQVRDSLLNAWARGARLIGLGTGVFTLGAAGLLDGRSVTTHWRYADQLRVSYPRARVTAALFMEDGQLFTSPGLAAAIDLHVELISRDLGMEVARRVAQATVTAPVRAGDLSQVVDRPLPAAPDAGLAHVRAWMIDHLQEPMMLDDLARRAFMSRRQFTRVFRAETGISPLQWMLRERLREARRMLESTREQVEQIGYKCGFATPASFRMHFRRATGVTPSAYRSAYRHALRLEAAS